jgi:carboxypeptidase family protein
MRPVSRYVALIALVLVMVPTMSSAQFRGLGRITGTVTEEGGGPLNNVSIRATLTGEDGVIEEKSDSSGAWAVSGVAKGEWHLTFQIAGYVPVGAKVLLPAELARIAPISITLKKVAKG